MRFRSVAVAAGIIATLALAKKTDAQESWLPYGTLGASDITVTPSGVVWLVAREQGAARPSLVLGEKPFGAPDGVPARVAADLDGFPWLVTADSALWHYVRTGPGKEEWQRLPLKAIDIAVGANGSVWAVDSGHVVVSLTADGAKPIGGRASRIAVDPSGNPWITDATGQVSQWTEGKWKPVGGNATDISIAPDGAVFILGTTKVPGGFEILRLKGNEWEHIVGGGGIAIAAGPKGIFVAQDAAANRVLSSEMGALRVGQNPATPVQGPLEALLSKTPPPNNTVAPAGSSVATAIPAAATASAVPSTPPPPQTVPVPGRLACQADLASCVAKGGDLLAWQLGQFPEPGMYRFMPGLLSMALSDPRAVDAFLAERANGDSALKRQKWAKMISDPAGSPEMKALLFASLLKAARADNPGADAQQTLAEFESYMRSRRFYVAQEAMRIYRKAREVDSISVTLPKDSAGGTRSITGAQGIPITDFKSHAWSATIPDSAGMAFIMAYSVLPGHDPFTSSAAALVASAMKASKGVFSSTGKDQIAADYTKYLEQMSFPVKLKEMVNSTLSEEKESLILYWALATSPHYAAEKLGDGQMTGVELCVAGPWTMNQCVSAKKLIRAAAQSVGYAN
jgi:hypothetical protein